MRKLAALLCASVLAFTVAACDPAHPRGVEWYELNTGPRVEPDHYCDNGDIRSGTATAPFVLSRCIFLDGIYAGGKDHVQVEDSLILGRVNMGYGDSTGWTFLYTEHDGSSLTTDASQIGDAGFALIRADIHGGSIGVWFREDVAVVESYVHDLTMRNAGAHREAIGSSGSGDGTGAKIYSNWLDVSNDLRGLSGALAMYGDFQQIQNVEVDGNYLNGSGSYTTYAGACPGKPYPVANNVDYTNNTFGPDMQYGHVSCKPSDSASEWSGNVTTAGVPVG